MPEPEKRRILAAIAAKTAADAEFKASIVESTGSVRELADFAKLSTNTVTRWKRGE